MNDERIWSFEKSLWTAESDEYHHKIASEGIMVVPAHPFVLHGEQAADAMSETPKWESVEFTDRLVARPGGEEGGLIVIAYKANATRGEMSYAAYCSTTLLRQGEDEWVVVQHQQTPSVTA